MITEQSIKFEERSDINILFNDILGLSYDATNKFSCFLNNSSGIALYGGVAGNSTQNFSIRDKNNNSVISSFDPGTSSFCYYHIGTNSTVKYFRICINSPSSGSFMKTQSVVLAQDINNEWVIFAGDKMYSNFGVTGAYNNFFSGTYSSIVDDSNTYLAAKMVRLDTGVPFKDLYAVFSARDYSDTNYLVAFDGKPYRLVSMSNNATDASRYPSFAFPVND